MFTGKIVVHKDFDNKRNKEQVFRMRIRKKIKQMGFSWRRNGIQINKIDDDAFEFIGKCYNASVDYSETVFNLFNSFIFDIPGLVDGFVLGGTSRWAETQYKLFKHLLLNSYKSHQIIALYTHYPDYLAHKKKNVDLVYKEEFQLAQIMSEKDDVLLLSDHGCSNSTGLHTDQAYIGANFPFKAETVLDVEKVVRERLIK
jgi:hypothetical protein